MAGLTLTVAKRALPQPSSSSVDDEPLIEALQTGDIAALDDYGPGLADGRDSLGNRWFFIALETGSLATLEWFLTHGASPIVPDRAGRLPLETVIQRAAFADEFDDHTSDCPAMAEMLLAAGASSSARNVQGETLADLARAAGLDLSQ